MIQYEVPNNTQRITIGVQGEENVREFLFDVTDWRQLVGNIGTAEMVIRRYGDSSPYAATITMHDANTVSWVPKLADTIRAGIGKMQLMWIADGQTVKTRIFDMKVDPALDYQLPDDSFDPWESWVTDVINAGAMVTEYAPIITGLEQTVNNEVQSRTTADAALNSRIDGIIAPTGEAPSTEEILDARTGVDGTNYASLGAAVRGQAADLKSALGKIESVVAVSSTVDFSTATYISGLIVKSNVWKTNSGYQSYKIPCPENAAKIKLTAANNGSAFGLLKDDNFVANQTPNYCTGTSRFWVNAEEYTEVIIPDDCKFIIITKRDNSTIYTPSETAIIFLKNVPYVDNTLAISGGAADALVTGNNISAIASVISNGEEMPIVFQPGSFIGSTGLPATIIRDDRLRTIDFIDVSNISSMSVIDGYEVALLAWDENGDYIGVYFGDNTFAKETSFYYMTGLIDLTDFSGYKIKITMRSKDNATLTARDGQYCHIYENQYTDEEYIEAFVAAMNKKASLIGMTNSTFNNPSGMVMDNYSTADDLVKLTIACAGYPEMNRVWNKQSYAVTTKDLAHKTVAIASTVINPLLNDYYYIFGGKTGHANSNAANTLVAICEVEGKKVVGAIAGASTTDNRFVAMKELMDIAKSYISGGTPTGTVTHATYAACALLPECPSMYEGYPVTYIYRQSADVEFVPMSVTKCLAMITMLDFLKDIDELNTFISSDNIGGSGVIFAVNDIISYRDAFYASMLASSNMAVQLIARGVGRKLLETYKMSHLLS